MAKHKLAADRVSEYDAKIKDLEAKAVSAAEQPAAKTWRWKWPKRFRP